MQEPRSLREIVDFYMKTGCRRVQLDIFFSVRIDGEEQTPTCEARGEVFGEDGRAMISRLEVIGTTIQEDVERRLCATLTAPRHQGRSKIGERYFAFDSMRTGTRAVVKIHLHTDPEDVTKALLERS